MGQQNPHGPMQALLNLIGIGVTALSVTGVLVWPRKRESRSIKLGN